MRLLKKTLRVFFVFTLVLAVLGAAAAGGAYWHFSQGLPDFHVKYRPAVASRVHTADGALLGEFFGEQHRHVVKFDEIPDVMVKAFLASEDKDFYSHPGIDLVAIARAFVENLSAGGIKQGGSTITQQVCKNIFLSNERTYERKAKEAICAYRIEQNLTKEQILELYLNEIYLGHGAYGVAAAMEVYFGKEIGDATAIEASIIAGLGRAPSRYDPHKSVQHAKMRQLYVLQQMVRAGWLAPEDEQRVYQADLGLVDPGEQESADPGVLEIVRREMVERYGNDALLEQGLTIYTSLDLGLQAKAREAVTQGVRDLDKRMGWRGPLETLDAGAAAVAATVLRDQEVVPGAVLEGLVLDVDDGKKKVTVNLGKAHGVIPLYQMEWAEPPDPEIHYSRRNLKKPSAALSPGDRVLVRVVGEVEPGHPVELALEQKPAPQGALVAIEPGTRRIRALVGAYDPEESEFNRALQAKRQPGSSFKPLIYTTAFEQGYTAATIVVDSPIIEKRDFESFKRGGYKPQNFDGKFKGPIPVRTALIHSRNVPTIKVLKDIGVRPVIEVARRLGITSHLDEDLTLALGSSGLSLLEIANTYAVFATGGVLRDPVLITRVVDRDGEVLEDVAELDAAGGEQVLDPQIAYLMTYLLSQVVENGTGRRARELGRPAGGKTGTTNNYYDAWFVGFTPDLVCGVWTGLDDRKSLGRGETGSRAALPTWVQFMKDAHEGLPIRPFDAPPGIEWHRIDVATGGPPTANTVDTLTLPFVEGTLPVAATPTDRARFGTGEPVDFNQLDF